MEADYDETFSPVLQDEVFMKQPQGFVDPTYPNFVCKLWKSLYGLKEVPYAWSAKFTGYLPTMGFTVSPSDSSPFVKKTSYDILILLLYVDNIVLIDSNLELVNSAYGKMFANQAKYAKDLLKKAAMHRCKPCSTPFKPRQQALTYDGLTLNDPTLYRSIVETVSI
ncbi:unnamed protein product [Prunus armeniaca]